MGVVLDKHRIELRVAQLVSRMPPMPEHIDRILTAEVRQDRNELMGLIEKDPGFCSELLHLASSSCYREMNQPETIEDAAASVDINALAQMVGVSYAQDVIETEFNEMRYLDEYFLHSRQISRASMILADVIGLDDHKKRLFATSGLIHDIGRLIILLASDRKGASLIGTNWGEMMQIVSEEKELLGMDHTVVGEMVCSKWNFSGILCEGVLRHHSPVIGEDFSGVGSLIFVSHFLASSDFTGDILEKMLPKALLNKMNLTCEQFDIAKERYDEDTVSL